MLPPNASEKAVSPAPAEGHHFTNGRPDFERKFIGCFVRGGGSGLLRDIGGLPALHKIVAGFTDELAHSVGMVVCHLISQGVASRVTPEAIVLAALDLDVPDHLGMIDVFALGSLPHDEALRAVNEGWFF